MNIPHSNRELLDLAEISLQNGEISTAKKYLAQVKLEELTGTQPAFYTRLCWRSGQAEQGLRYLNPLLKNKALRLTSGEWAEYAMCLNAIGASQEAQETLKEKCPADPFFNLYMGFSLIYEWDYLSAIPFLEKTINQNDFPPYQRVVAQVNLLGAYIAENLIPEAVRQYEELMLHTPPEYRRLQSNLKELSLQLLVAQKKFSQALEILNTNLDSSPTEGPEAFYHKKWKTIIEVEMGLKDLSALLALRNEALQSERWEIARDCEARVAFKTQNPIFLKRVYYATPWPAYRKKIYSRFASEINLESPFEFWLTPERELSFNTSKRPVDFKQALDVEKGESGSLKLKKGSLPHRLLRALCSDLFRPHPIGALFHRLFENEKFDLASTPTRIYRAVSELREILTSANMPLEIVQHPQGYYLRCNEPTCLILPSDRIASKSLIRLSPLQSWGEQEFSAKDVAQSLGVSLKTAQRLLNEALSGGLLLKTGEGAQTRYKWSK